MSGIRLWVLVLLSFGMMFQGCGGVPKDALRMNAATLEDRQLQTKLFDTSDEQNILSASASLLQDLGFNIDESEVELGLLAASKDRGAVNPGQVVLSFMAALGGSYAPYDTKQKIRASIVTSPVGENGERMAVRVTFQRTVWNSDGQISKLEKLDDPEMYQGFFDKLSKAVFLEAHGI